jgi:hypothetical protein
MSRKSVLEDRSKRNRVLRVLADGGTIDAAAKEIGASHMAIARYREKFPDYDEAIKRAMAEGYRAARGAGPMTPGVEHEAVPRTKSRPITVDAEVVSEAFGLDAEYVLDVDAHVQSDAEIDAPEGVGRLTVRSFMDLCWRRASSERKDAASWGRLLAPVMLGPTIRGQERREEETARQGTIDAQRALTVESTLVGGVGVAGARPRGGGMVVLEVPPNKARPHVPKAPDADTPDPEPASGMTVVRQR